MGQRIKRNGSWFQRVCNLVGEMRPSCGEEQMKTKQEIPVEGALISSYRL